MTNQPINANGMNQPNQFELSKHADQILKNAGYDIFGRTDSTHAQISFEYNMRTGAYSSNQSKRK